MGEGEFKTQPHLMAQDAANVDASKLTALSPEVVSAGHVDVQVVVFQFQCDRFSRIHVFHVSIRPHFLH